MKISLLKTVVPSILLSAATAVPAAQIGLTAIDSAGSTSFNVAGHWSNNQAPNATNDYNTGGYQLRSPADANNYTFAGASLTFSNNSLAGAGNGSFLDKSGGTRTLTINNLTNLVGALVRSGDVNGTTVHLAGNHWTIAGGSELRADQNIWIIDSPLLGADGITLTNHYSNNSPPNHISYTANNSGFTGNWYIFGDGANASTYVELQAANSQPGNPSTFTPGQITLGPNGLLLDTAGTTFNNPNGGFTFTGNATINSPSTTVIGEPITGNFSLTKTGSGTLVLSNANNTYTGGTTISAGNLQQGVNNAIPGNAVAGDVTDNGTLDLNGYNATINGLNGSGTVDSISGGTPTLTVGANGDNGTFSGTIQNSSGTLSFTKTGAGVQTISGTYICGGTTAISGGTLALATASPATPGNLVINNGALAVTLTAGVNGVNASGSLTLQDNATNNFVFGTVAENPTEIPINVSGGIAAPGTNIVINISGLGLKAGTFTLIKYTGASLAGIGNFSLVLPPGVYGTLANNTGNDSIDVNITATPNQLSWFGTAGGTWDLSTPNWSNDITGAITVFQQYTNNGVVAGDSVVFDDTLTNSSPQPTNITLNTTFFAFPVVFNSSLPYSISGTGGIAGPTSLVVSNTGSFSLLTSNSFTGAVSVYGGTLVITNDDALGTNNSLLTLNGGSLQVNGTTTNNVRPLTLPVATTIGVGAGANARFGGNISGATLNKGDLGTLILGGTNVYSGDLFVNSGTVVIDSGLVTNNTYDSIGQQNSDNGILTIQGTGALYESGDFNVGDIGSSVGTLNLSGSAKVVAGQIFIASANATGSTAQGTVNQNGGTVTELNQATGNFVIGGRNAGSTLGVGIYNLNSGTLAAGGNVRLGSQGTGTLNQNGGTFFATNGINLARFAGSSGTYNLTAGTLVTTNLASSTGVNAIFNFNGGTLKSTPVGQPTWVSALSQANVQAGGAFLDDSGNTLTIANGLLAASTTGGVTKQGAGTIILAGTNTFTGPITNNAGTLFLNSLSTYTGAAQVNAGTLQLSTASILQGASAVKTNATLSVLQSGSSTVTVGNLTLNGLASLPGATLAVILSGANVATVPVINAGTLTLNGTNTLNVSGALPLGPTAIIQYAGAIAGSGNITNLVLPQGAGGYVSNNAASSTLYVVVTNSGPGLVWTGTNGAAGRTNLWDINSTTNWLVNGKPTWYQQFVIPGDAVTFNDTGSGSVLLSNTVSPASMVISNNARSYTFSGTGLISGNTGLVKLGTGTALINLTNNNYSGNTTISNGTLQIGNAAAISPNANLVIGQSGTFELNGQSPTGGDLIGSGTVDDSAGDMLLTIGGSSGGIWNGTIQDQGRGGVALTKNGGGTWVVGGTNILGNGSSFQFQNQFTAGTTIITNSGAIVSPLCQTWIGNGSTATMIVSGGTLYVSNNILTIGNAANANGALIVNSGTVIHGGGVNNVFGNVNNLFVGAGGGTGTLIVNGGQVLNSQALTLAQSSGSTGTFFLNGGLVQANAILTASTTTSTNFFNGGTLQAITNSTDFIQVLSLIMSNGLVLDDAGWTVTISSAALQPGDAFGGGMIKKGAGAVYLDSGNTYTGTTVVTNGFLAGSGSVSGPLVVAPAGTLGAGDAGGTGSFTINGSLSVQGAAVMRINRDTPANDQLAVSGNVTYGGTLIVSNLSTTALTTSDSFQLFSVSGAANGNFANIVGSPGAGLSYVFNPATGVLSVTNVVVKSIPHITTIHLSGTTLTIAGTNGTPSGQYVVLGSTNVALPVLQWTPLLTNQFNPDGTFSLTTNIVNPGVPIEFYLLSQ